MLVRREALAVRYAGTERDDDGPWFRLGQLDVNTAILILLVWTAMLVVWVIEGPARTVTAQLVLNTDSVASGQVWRLVTWPFTHLSFQLWDIINAAVLFFFATDLERQTGRRAFSILVGSAIVTIGVAATILAQILGSAKLLAGLDLLALTVVLLYCAEHPTRPFFFGIPAWVIGAVIAALEIVNDLGNRDGTRLLTVLIASALITLIAKRVGLLSMYDKVPELRLPERARKPAGERKAPKPAKGKSSGGGLAGRFGRGKEAEIVEMPPPQSSRFEAPRRMPTPPPAEAAAPPSADDVLLDSLLDKISAGGMDSLSADERRQLDEIRERRSKS